MAASSCVVRPRDNHMMLLNSRLRAEYDGRLEQALVVLLICKFLLVYDRACVLTGRVDASVLGAQIENHRIVADGLGDLLARGRAL